LKAMEHKVMNHDIETLRAFAVEKLAQLSGKALTAKERTAIPAQEMLTTKRILCTLH